MYYQTVNRLFQVLVLSQITLVFLLGLGLTVTEINIKKSTETRLKKNIKNVNRGRDGMPKSMRTR